MVRGGNRQQFQPPVLRKMRAIAIESLQYKDFEPLDAEHLALDGSKKGLNPLSGMPSPLRQQALAIKAIRLVSFRLRLFF